MQAEIVWKVDSTNSELLRRVRMGQAPPQALLAAAQTNGRGQPGKTWDSPHGGLYLSVLLRDRFPRAISPAVRAGTAACSELRAASGLPVRLKWPNDCYVEGCKLAGILVERAPGGILVIGLGVNVGPQSSPGRVGLDPSFAPGDAYPGAPAWRALGLDLVRSLECAFSTLHPAPLELAAWEAMSVLPQPVTLADGRPGTALGLLADGSLQVQVVDGPLVQIVSSAGLRWPELRDDV